VDATLACATSVAEAATAASAPAAKSIYHAVCQLDARALSPRARSMPRALPTQTARSSRWVRGGVKWPAGPSSSRFRIHSVDTQPCERRSVRTRRRSATRRGRRCVAVGRRKTGTLSITLGRVDVALRRRLLTTGDGD